MKVTVLNENLKRALSQVKPAVNKLHSEIRVFTQWGHLYFETNNREFALQSYIGSKVEVEGEFVIEFTKLNTFAQSFKDCVIDFHLVDDALEMKSSEGTRVSVSVVKYNLPNPVDFDVSRYPNQVTISDSDFRAMTSKVVFAAATDDSRPILTGVKLLVEGETLTAAAADGFRLSVFDCPGAYGFAHGWQGIIPAFALSAFARAMPKLKKGEIGHDVSIALHNDETFIVTQGKLKLKVQSIAGTFPDYHQLIPVHRDTVAIVGRKALMQAVKSMKPILAENRNTVQLKMNPALDEYVGEFVVRAMGDKQFSFQTIDAEIEGAANVCIALNSEFLTQVLSAINDNNVEIVSKNSTSPVKITGKGESNFVHVIMPMRV